MESRRIKAPEGTASPAPGRVARCPKDPLYDPRREFSPSPAPLRWQWLPSSVFWVRSVGGPEAVREKYGIFAPAISLVAHTAVNTTPFGDLIPWAVANGAIYGFAQGALLSWLAWMGSSFLQFLIARRTALDFDLAGHLDRLPRWVRRLPVDRPTFLIVARWVPMGGAVANLAAGALGVKMSRLVWCVAIGAAPPAIALSAVGAGMLRFL